MDFGENAGSESESDYLPSPTAPEPEPNVTVKEEEEEGHSDMADPGESMLREVGPRR